MQNTKGVKQTGLSNLLVQFPVGDFEPLEGMNDENIMELAKDEWSLHLDGASWN